MGGGRRGGGKPLKAKKHNDYVVNKLRLSFLNFLP